MTNFAIRQGCKLRITKSYFTWRFRQSIFEGESEMTVEVLRHSYGDKLCQHTFTCKVLEILSNGSRLTHEVGDTFRVKGRNLYPCVLNHIQGQVSLTTRSYNE